MEFTEQELKDLVTIIENWDGYRGRSSDTDHDEDDRIEVSRSKILNKIRQGLLVKPRCIHCYSEIEECCGGAGGVVIDGLWVHVGYKAHNGPFNCDCLPGCVAEP